MCHISPTDHYIITQTMASADHDANLKILAGCHDLTESFALFNQALSPIDASKQLQKVVKKFLLLAADWTPIMIESRLGTTKNLARAIAWQLVQDASTCDSICEYLSGITHNSFGGEMLMALEILTQNGENADCLPSLVTTIASLLDVTLDRAFVSDSDAAEVDKSNINIENENGDIDSDNESVPTAISIGGFEVKLAPIPMFFEDLHHAVRVTTLHSLSVPSLPLTSDYLVLQLMSILCNLIISHRNAPDAARTFMKARTLSAIMNGLLQTDGGRSQGLNIVHRLLVRFLTVFSSAASTNKLGISLLRGAQVIPRLLTALHDPKVLHRDVNMELSELLTWILDCASSISTQLWEDFEHHSGYQVIERNMMYICERERNEKHLREYLSCVCNLVFVSGEKNRMAKNPDAFLILLRIFEKCQDSFVRNILLEHVSDILFAHSRNPAILLPNDPFRNVLDKRFFISLEHTLQCNILDILERLLKLSGGSGLMKELKLVMQLLEVTHPPTIITCLRWIIRMMKRRILTADALRTSGIFPILVGFIQPIHNIPCIRHYIRNSVPLSGIEIRGILECVVLISSSQSTSASTIENEDEGENEGEDENEDENGDFSISKVIKSVENLTGRTLNIPDPSEECLPLPFEIAEVGGVVSAVTLIGYTTCVLSLELCFGFVSGNVTNQAMFRDRNGLLSLYAGLPDAIIRKAALNVVSALAIADVKQEWRIIPDLLALLQSSGGSSTTEVSVLELRKDVLSTLRHVFWSSEPAKSTFRVHGGFVWLVSVLGGLSSAIEIENMNSVSVSNATSEAEVEGKKEEGKGVQVSLQVSGFVTSLLHCLSAGLSANVENQRYFRETIGFGTLTEPLNTCRMMYSDETAVSLCHALLDVSVRGVWPPQCSIAMNAKAHAHDSNCRANDIRRNVQNRERERHAKNQPRFEPPDICRDVSSSDLCWNCRRSFVVENPGAAAVLLQLVGKPNISLKIVSHALVDILILVYASSENRARFAAIEFTAHLVGNLRDAKNRRSECGIDVDDSHSAHTHTNSNGNDSYDIEPLLLSLIERVAQHSMSHREMRRILALCGSRSDSRFSLNVIDTLTNIFRRANNPSHYVDLRNMDHKCGIVQLPILGDVLWPPIQGYSFSQWMRVDSYGENGVGRSALVMLGMWSSFPEKRRLIIRVRHGVISVCWSVLGSSSDREKEREKEKERERERDEKAASPSPSPDSSSYSTKDVLDDSIDFSGFVLKPRKWYHVCICHQRQRTSKRGLITLYIDGEEVGNGNLLYPYPIHCTELGAQLGGSDPTLPQHHHHHVSSSSNRMRKTQAQSSTSSSTTIPTPTPDTIMGDYGDNGCPGLTWRAGNTFLFESTLSKKDACILYGLGGEFIGSLDGDLGRLYTTDLVTIKSAQLFKDDPSPILNLSTHSLSHLATAVILAFRARNGIAAQCMRNAFASTITENDLNLKVSTKTKTKASLNMKTKGRTHTQQKQRTLLVPVHAKLRHFAVSRHRRQAKDVAINVGGVGAFLFLLARSTSQQEQNSTIRLLVQLLRHSALAQSDAHRLNAIELLGQLLRTSASTSTATSTATVVESASTLTPTSSSPSSSSPSSSWVLGEDLVACLFSLCGLAKVSITYSYGVISDAASLIQLLLDWRIWHQAPVGVQEIILSSLVDVVGQGKEGSGGVESNVAKFNAERLMENGIVDHLLRTFVDFAHVINLTPKLFDLFTRLLRGVIHSSDVYSGTSTLFESDILSIIDYLVLTHDAGEEDGEGEGEGESDGKSVSMSRKKEDVYAFSVVSAPSTSEKTSSSTSNSNMSHIRTHTSAITIRSCVIDLLASILNESESPAPTPDTPEPEYRPFFSLRGSQPQKEKDVVALDHFSEHCTIEMLLSLCGCKYAIERASMVSLVNAALQHPAIWFKFVKINGFAVLGHVLSVYKVTTHVIDALGDMLCRIPRGESFLSLGSTSFGTRSIWKIKHAECVKTLLILIKRCPMDGHMNFELRDTTLNVIATLLRQGEQICRPLLQSDIVRYLCELMPSEIVGSSLSAVVNGTHSRPFAVLVELLCFAFKTKGIGGEFLDEVLYALSLDEAEFSGVGSEGEGGGGGESIENDKKEEKKEEKFDARSIIWLLKAHAIDLSIRQFFKQLPEAAHRNLEQETKVIIQSLEHVCLLAVDFGIQWIRPMNISMGVSMNSSTSYTYSESQAQAQSRENGLEPAGSRSRSRSRSWVVVGESESEGEGVEGEGEGVDTSAKRSVRIHSSRDEDVDTSDVHGISPLPPSPSSGGEGEGEGEKEKDEFRKRGIDFINSLLLHMADLLLQVPSHYSQDNLLAPLGRLLLTLLMDACQDIVSIPLKYANNQHSFAYTLFDDEEFGSRLIYYTSHLLKSDVLRQSAGEVWDTILQSQPKYLSSILDVEGEGVGEGVGEGEGEIVDISLELKSKVAIEVKHCEVRDSARLWRRVGVFERKLKKKNGEIMNVNSNLKFYLNQLETVFIEKRQGQLRKSYQRIQKDLENEASLRMQWRSIVCAVTHERAVWGHPMLSAWVAGQESTNTNSSSSSVEMGMSTCARVPQIVSFELDPIEGPFRQRKRLRRLVFIKGIGLPAPILSIIEPNVDMSQLLLKSESEKEKESKSSSASASSSSSSSSSGKSTIDGLLIPYGFYHLVQPNEGDDSAQVKHVEGDEHVQYTTHCSRITPFYRREGELLFCDSRVYFLAEVVEVERSVVGTGTDAGDKVSTSSSSGVGGGHRQTDRTGSFSFTYNDVREIHRRRYLLKANALEIFLLSGGTVLLAFHDAAERDDVQKRLINAGLPNFVNYEDEVAGTLLRKSITQRWQDGQMSNFEYLMHLNTLAGRSYNDMTQYPVYPWVLKDFTSARLDLDDPRVYRDLAKPMGAQDEKRLEKFREKYSALQEMEADGGTPPYLYGSHYSNVGTVLHYVVRTRPFSDFFLSFQGGRFDIPDRTFHSVSNAWYLASQGSSSDVKELIPEFFFLPEFLENRNGFDFGEKQDGTRVNDVELPPWANGSARRFIELHRAALESDYVSIHLHEWIDLIFGYKQRGEEAIKSHNVFHPLTYEGAVEIDEIQEPIEREATIVQISNYGQTPAQLFKKPHPSRRHVSTQPQPLIHIRPTHLMAFPIRTFNESVGMIDVIDSSSSVVVLGPRRCLIKPEKNTYLSWGNWDQSLRICSLDTGKVLVVIDGMPDDDTLCSAVTSDGRTFVTGGTSTVVKFWDMSASHSLSSSSSSSSLSSAVGTSSSSGSSSVGKRSVSRVPTLKAALNGHGAAILSIVCSQEWGIAITGSVDRTCILWDLHRPFYLRTLGGHEGPVTVVSISSATGTIATFCRESGRSGGIMRLWTINGDLIARKQTREVATCITFTTGIEGVAPNVLVVGLKNRSILLANSTTLETVTILDSPHAHAQANQNAHVPSASSSAGITAIFVTDDNSAIFTGDCDGNVVKWRVSSKSVKGIQMSNNNSNVMTMADGHGTGRGSGKSIISEKEKEKEKEKMSEGNDGDNVDNDSDDDTGDSKGENDNKNIMNAMEVVSMLSASEMMFTGQ